MQWQGSSQYPKTAIAHAMLHNGSGDAEKPISSSGRPKTPFPVDTLDK
jgi:hypothetical protein